ncbi:MAG: hypothetical protein NTW18_04885 [Candidatus Omnitrophica bacterium]|nr:hypothetical protein [Candidatus Omnitrophota bacterium]
MKTLNLEYSTKERFGKIVDIIAEGVVRLIQYKARLFQNVREWLGEVFQRMLEDKSVTSCTIASSISEIDILKGKRRKEDFYYREPIGKIHSFTLTIIRD